MSWLSLRPETRAVCEQVLTRKQLDVLKLRMAGCGYRRIATMLGISPSTVRSHWQEAWRKLGDQGVDDPALAALAAG